MACRGPVSLTKFRLIDIFGKLKIEFHRGEGVGREFHGFFRGGVEVSVTLIQPQYKGGAFKGPANGQCLNCMDEQEYDLTVPANREDFINVKRPERR